jgi:hypothetical protein
MLGRRVKETMSAQVAALQALSEGLLTFLFPSQRKMRELLKRAYPQQDLWSSLLQDPLVRQELGRLAQAIKELARPLAYAKDATELEHTINDQLLSAYLVWKGELFTLVLNKALPKAGSAAFLDEYASAIQQIQQFFQEQAAHYLDPENVERLESALYGVCLYSKNIMRTILEEGPDALDPDAVKDTIKDFVKADLLFDDSRAHFDWRNQAVALDYALETAQPACEDSVSDRPTSGGTCKRYRRQVAHS